MEKENFAYLEWEFLTKPISISKIDTNENLPMGNKEIKVSRDDQYNIQGIITGKQDTSFFDNIKNGKPGESVVPFNITGTDIDEYHKYLIQYCYLGDLNVHKIVNEVIWEIKLILYSLTRTNINENNAETIIDWYINGPQHQIFCHSTSRELPFQYKKERKISSDETFHTLEADGLSRSIDIDFIKVEIPDFTFLINYVPEIYGPEWSNNVGFEYRSEWGKLPKEKERKIISELCSFIFGRQLMNIGYTILDKDNYIIEEYACDPLINEPRTICSKPDAPPIKIHKPIFNKKTEELINQLLPKYIQYRDIYNFKNSLIIYWLARNMPIGSQLPIYSSALESLINGWLKSNNSKSRGKYFKDGDFKKLFNDELDSIKNKIELKKNKINSKSKLNKKENDLIFSLNGILKKVEYLNNMGVNDGIRKFFKEINLELNDIEWETINARNKFAHGRLNTQSEKYEKEYQYSFIYDTLLHKVMLRLLEYTGDYINRSIIGWKDEVL